MVKYVSHSFKAMGSTISMQVELDERLAESLFKQVEDLFAEITSIASRFDPDSELSLVNNHLNMTVDVDEHLSEMLKDAYYGYQITDGKFDPRVIESLKSLGYIDTFLDNQWGAVKIKTVTVREPWKPMLDNGRVFIGNNPVDLGGVGKSYTAWKASLILDEYSRNFYINAGGDILFAGHAPEGEEWTVGVDNPYMRDSDQPLAVLGVLELCVATSSIAKHSRDAEGKKLHHIIDPSTGMPADNGIVAVTVLHNDLITAEIWSKTFFLESPEGFQEITDNLQLPVLWFTDDNQMHYNEFMKPYIRWTI